MNTFRGWANAIFQKGAGSHRLRTRSPADLPHAGFAARSDRYFRKVLLRWLQSHPSWATIKISPFQIEPSIEILSTQDGRFSRKFPCISKRKRSN
jgi:hypothetical protein